ncbi:MAG: hypothetical protein IJ410_03585 [Oscillospiraceae bacterium]|nr:hypothetical protein [Oscillospiraceae bacterium]
MAEQMLQLKIDRNKTPEENLKTVVKFINNMVTTLNHALNNIDMADVNSESGVSLQDLYALGALKGEPGKNGADGKNGKDGVGVPTGGTAGQVLVKKSDDDYDTEWVDIPV